MQHLGVVGEPDGSGRGECVRGAINNRAPHRSPPRSRHRLRMPADAGSCIRSCRGTGCYFNDEVNPIFLEGCASVSPTLLLIENGKTRVNPNPDFRNVHDDDV